MPSKLQVAIGTFSEAGRKSCNQDCLGYRVPDENLCRTKGIAAAIADGISSSEYGKEASHACVTGFMEDYFSTHETWSVKKSAAHVLTALNRWLYTRGKNELEQHRGRVSTLSALILKSTTAHVIHIGDSRIYRLRDGTLEQLTVDHKTWLSRDRSYLSRAMGADNHLEIDYSKNALEKGDIFVLTTDGVHEYLGNDEITRIMLDNQNNPDKAAQIMARASLDKGSPDNVSCLILKILDLPSQDPDEVFQQLTEFPFPPELREGMIIDGYKIVRELHTSSRSQLYLAIDTDTGLRVVLKTPSVNYEDEPAYIERFTMEEWVGRRINNPHVVKVYEPARRRRFLYHITEHLQGQTLRQWMHDHPAPGLEEVRTLVEQIAHGLQAFHRLEMVHQDLKPENIIIDETGTVKLIDFGSTRVAGFTEIATPVEHSNLLGTKNYSAPEYADNRPGSNRSDIYSLGVITYEMLTGKLPYGEMPANRNRKIHMSDFKYTPVMDNNHEVPDWIDAMLRKAVNVNPDNRYEELSEFFYDLRHPNTSLLYKDHRPLLERNPLAFWRGLSLILLGIIIYLLFLLAH
jgi:serine/threonine protein kinase